MYRTCLFCNKDLGSNEVLETFPVGTRLAFDPAKGRLWVVCRKCERWNLSPLEERWEAIEDAERFFRDTRVRVSTEHIGLARHPSGLELVRIGAPMRPEFAAWRYGDQFGRRRRKAMVAGGAVLAAASMVVVGGVAMGVAGGALFQVGNVANSIVNGRTLVKLPLPDGRILKLKRPDLQRIELVPSTSGEPWSLAIGRRKKRRVFTGNEARRVASIVMPAVNASGAKRTQVQDAVRTLERAGGPELFVRDVTAHLLTRRESIWHEPPFSQMSSIPAPTRLAFEMALHEEQERRAFEGELKELELAWRAAEEIAQISDDLLLPESARHLAAD